MAGSKEVSKALTDEQVLKLVEGHIQSSVGYLNQELKQEREEVQQYIDLELPKRNALGKSTYTSQDVADSVWMMHAQILETFCGNRRIVKFAPKSADDVRLADIQTECCAHTFFEQNRGYDVASSVIYDGLTSRIGIAKVWWDIDFCIEDKVWPERLSLEEVNGLDQSLEDDIVEITAEGPGEDGLYQVTIHTQVDKSQVRVEAVPPEEFLASKKTRRVDKAPFLAHRTRWTYQQLKDEGYTEEQIQKIGESHWIEDEETILRFEDVDGGEERVDDGPPEFQGKVVWVYECYVKANIDKTRIYTWKILKAGNLILSKEKIKKHPFIVFSPLRVPHKMWGPNYAKKNFHSQNVTTALVRSVVDHTLVTANPRYTVLNGGVSNPAEIRDNRLGGLINILKPEAIQPLEQYPLNPYVFQTLATIDQRREATNGISALSQGLNKDAVSKQNSADLVEQLTLNSQIRQKIIARNFAEWMIDLFLMISDLLIENEKQERIVAVAGDFVQVDITQWQRREDMIVDVSLGYGDSDREATKWMMMHQMLSADPATAQQYGPSQKYRVIKRILELRGIKDVANYYLPPEQTPPPQPDPIKVAELQLKQAEVELKKADAAMEESKAAHQVEADQHKYEIELKKLDLEAQKLANEREFKMAEIELKREELASKERIAEQEMAVVKAKAAEGPVTAIASPNS